jgi:hypothetical protein
MTSSDAAYIHDSLSYNYSTELQTCFAVHGSYYGFLDQSHAC